MEPGGCVVDGHRGPAAPEHRRGEGEGVEEIDARTRRGEREPRLVDRDAVGERRDVGLEVEVRERRRGVGAGEEDELGGGEAPQLADERQRVALDARQAVGAKQGGVDADAQAR